MSDFLMAFYDADRDAVVVRLQSGTEVAVMDLDEADGFGNEVKAAARKEATGYDEFFMQENGEDPTGADLDEYLRPDGEPLDPNTNPFAGEFHPDEQTCPSCAKPRPYAVAPGVFLSYSECPGCGHVAPPVETEQGNYLISLGDGGDIAVIDEDGNSVDSFRLDNALPTEAEDWANYAQALNVTRVNVLAAVTALSAAADSDPNEQTLLDVDDALRALDTDIVPPTCILTGEPGENSDDCTTHAHE